MADRDAEVAAVARAYRRCYELAQGDRADRLRVDDHWWAWERVEEEVHEGDRPLELLDALVHDPDGDFDYRMYIGAGPLEDLLNLHAGRYADALAERCRCDELWADALRGVWVDRALWSALPEELRRVVPEPRPVRSRTRPSSRPRSRREWS